MKKTSLTMVAIFLGVLVLFAVSINKSTMDIGTIAFFFSMGIYLIMFFSVSIKGNNSRLVNMRGIGSTSPQNYNAELIVADIAKVENQVGTPEGASNSAKWFLFAMATFYLVISIAYSFSI